MTSYSISMHFCITSLCNITAGSGRCILFRIESPDFNPSTSSLIEAIAVGSSLHIHIISKGKEQTEVISNAITENKWQMMQFTQTRSVKKGLFSIRSNGVDIFSAKMLMPSKESLIGGKFRVCCEGFIVVICYLYYVGFLWFSIAK